MYKMEVQKRLEKGGFETTYATEKEDIVTAKLVDVLKNKYVYHSKWYGRMYCVNHYNGTETYTVYFADNKSMRIKMTVPC